MGTKFVVLCAGRSGSTLLCRTLTQITNLDVYECLNFDCRYGNKNIENYINQTYKDYQIPCIEAHLDPTYRNKVSNKEFFDSVFSFINGTKILFYQCEQSDFDILQYMKDNDIVPILLTRENVFEQFVSAKIAHRAKVWISDHRNQKTDLSPISIDINEYCRYYDNIHNYYERIIREFSNLYITSYEKLVYDWENEVKRICNKINVDIKNVPEKPLNKLVTKPVQEIVIDYHNLIRGIKTNLDIKYTVDWFSHQKHIFEKHLKHLRFRPVKFLEIGSYEGLSSIWLLDNILLHPLSTLTCIDIFRGDYANRFFNNMSNSGYLSSKCLPVIGKSDEILKKLSKNYYDFIYIDGSHRTPNVLEDAILSFKILKPGGILAFDDYEWTAEESRPKPAIDAFIECYKENIDILEKGYQVWIKKRN